jgi:hypothetical protein
LHSAAQESRRLDSQAADQKPAAEDNGNASEFAAAVKPVHERTGGGAQQPEESAGSRIDPEQIVDLRAAQVLLLDDGPV